MTSRLAKRKVPELDIIQSLAFLAVVLQSSLMYTMTQPNLAPEQAVMIGMFFNFAKFSAPAFIFIIGFSLFYNHDTQVNYKLYIKEKFYTLIVPYVVWSIIYMYTTQTSVPFIQIVKTLLKGSAAPHLWYVVMMFQVHILFPLLFLTFHAVRKRVHSKESLYRIMTVFALGYFGLMWLSSHFIFNGVTLTSSLFLKYTDRSFLFYSFYFMLGGVAAVTLPTWRKFIIKNVPLNTFLFLVLFVIVGYELLSFDGIQAIHLQVSTYLKPSMFIYITVEILLLYALAMTIVHSRTFVFTILTFISRFTYGSYLAHVFFLGISAKFLTAFHLANNTLTYSILLFIVTAVFSVTTIVACSFIPFGHMITGPVVKMMIKLPIPSLASFGPKTRKAK